jgi:hypothetical protein
MRNIVFRNHGDHEPAVPPHHVEAVDPRVARLQITQVEDKFAR